MTLKKQPLTWTTTQKAEETKLIEDNEITGGIRAVCDSIKKLNETLNRLVCVMQRKNIERSLTGKKYFFIEECAK